MVITLLVILTVTILYGRRFWKSQCQRGPAEAVPCVPEMEVSGFHLPGYQPDLDLPVLVTLGPKAPPTRNPLETHPLLRNSECSDCSAGGSSFTEVGHGSGGDPGHPTSPPSFCATEVQPHWPHAPVECTELDLQTFSSQVKHVVTGHKEDAEKMVAQEELHPEAPACPVYPAAQDQIAFVSAPNCSLSFRNPVVESGEQSGDDIQSLVAEIPSIVQSDHLGEELGVPPEKQPQISGFVELVTSLAGSGRPLSVLSLAQALRKLQRFDAFLLLYNHFVGNQTPNVGP
ncbi:hypothetical protein JD844_004196 [Phrynosoma platyrhinos]|uniref:Uncharacterized protein n=1 Tax=Phrynosoma platyrhinos TaxID=52577 RepID=A0ABQ7TMF9_PHRPL|nr:hypothetical protein JD844_004196 [Phrynosoma platyrhinos]